MKMDVIPAQGIFYGTVRVSNKTKGELRKGLEKNGVIWHDREGSRTRVLQIQKFSFSSFTFLFLYFKW